MSKIRKSCPCCGKILHISDYCFKTKMIDESEILACKYCNSKIIVNKKPILWNIVFYTFVVLVSITLSVSKDIYDFLITIIIFVAPMIVGHCIFTSFESFRE